MGTIEAYETAGGRRYRVRYRKPDHSQTAKRGFPTKKAAELFLAEVEVSKAAGTYLDPVSARITVGQLGAEWLASRSHLKPASVAVDGSTWRLHVLPVWGSVTVGQVRHSAVQAWVADLASGARGGKAKSAAVTKRAHRLLAGVLDVAVRDHRIGANPARGVPLPKQVAKEHRYLTHEQVRRLADACGAHAAVVQLLAYTGLRWGEAAALRVRDVSLARRRLYVARNATLVNGTMTLGTPKNYQRRWVPFPQLLVPTLEDALDGKNPDDLVFPAPNGAYMRTPTVQERSWYDRALEAAGLPPMTIHDLRHTAASLAVAAQANVKAVQHMLGHASAAMTLDVYADLFEDDLDGVATRLNEAALAADVSKKCPPGLAARTGEMPQQEKRPGILGQ